MKLILYKYLIPKSSIPGMVVFLHHQNSHKHKHARYVDCLISYKNLIIFVLQLSKQQLRKWCNFMQWFIWSSWQLWTYISNFMTFQIPNLLFRKHKNLKPGILFVFSTVSLNWSQKVLVRCVLYSILEGIIPKA